MDTPVWEKMGISQEQLEALPPAERWALDRQYNPQPLVQRRQRPYEIPYVPTPVEPSELDAIPDIHERATRYRALRDAYAAAQKG